jgi:hypothetical protein
MIGSGRNGSDGSWRKGDKRDGSTSNRGKCI